MATIADLEARIRIAQDLHDHIGNDLTATLFQIEVTKMLLTENDSIHTTGHQLQRYKICGTCYRHPCRCKYSVIVIKHCLIEVYQGIRMLYFELFNCLFQILGQIKEQFCASGNLLHRRALLLCRRRALFNTCG